MERWCETAAAVVNGHRNAMTPAQAAARAVVWRRLSRNTLLRHLSPESDALAKLSGGQFFLIRLFDEAGHVR